MAGPAIRAFEMAKVLAQVADVRLVSTVAAELSHENFSIGFADEEALRRSADWSDVIIFQGHVLSSFPWLKSDQYVLVADIYDPMHLEVLEQGKSLQVDERYAQSLSTSEVLNVQIERADFMVCASEKQRDFWLGQLAALSRINPATYDENANLRSLLDVAPFGIEDTPPEQLYHGIKGVVPGISATDTVVIWGGGIYNWFDPLTLVRAVASLSAGHPDLRLFFLGVKHPNPNVPEMEVSFRTRELASELGLLNTVVFFNDGWVPYADRSNYLLDADVGVSTHFDHLETSFSFRTRILDYLWAGLPIVSTDGDTFASIIRDNDLGCVVPPEDVPSLAQALETVLYSANVRSRVKNNVEAFAQTMKWSIVLRPLVAFCLDPKRAADHTRGVLSLRNNLLSVRNQHLKDLRVRIDGLEKSTSWRITRPLRLLSNIFHR